MYRDGTVALGVPGEDRMADRKGEAWRKKQTSGEQTPPRSEEPKTRMMEAGPSTLVGRPASREPYTDRIQVVDRRPEPLTSENGKLR